VPAQQAVRDHGDLPVPLHIRNAPTKLMKNLDYGKGYEYRSQLREELLAAGIFAGAASRQDVLRAGKNAREEELRKFLRGLWGDKYNY